MKQLVLLLLLSSFCVFAQNRDVSVQGAVGSLTARQSGSYVTTSVDMNVAFNDRLIAVQFSRGGLDFDEDRDFLGFAALYGYRPQFDYANVFMLGGIGLSKYSYLAGHSEDPRSYDRIRIGLAYEFGATLIPFSSVGFGAKVSGQLDQNPSIGAFVFIEIGNLRK